MIKLENIKVKENLYLSDSVCVIVGDLKMYFAFVLCFYQKKNPKKIGIKTCNTYRNAV